MDRFSTEEACKTYLRDARWPEGVRCPRCKNDKVYTLKQPFRWQCQKCAKNGYRFSVTTGTIFENTKYPLRQWFQVAYLICQSKKGISALQIHRQIRSGDYRTAWFMCHRIRCAMQGGAFPLTGEIEADETYIGGKDRNRHWNKKSAQVRKTMPALHVDEEAFGYGKIGVIGAIARKGNVVARVIGTQDAPTLSRFVRNVVDGGKVSLVATDEHPGYKRIDRTLPHEAVNHSHGEYVRGNVHTNNIESFWSLLKRGVVGTFHNVSAEYLPLYLNEFSWRYNNRNNPDIFRDLLSSV